ncbi:MAG: PEGA domain-containing protein [Kiritimatiellae bacterium]|nr:PEGA domain-containing protein [Kiritimatiellia bacterium]
MMRKWIGAGLALAWFGTLAAALAAPKAALFVQNRAGAAFDSKLDVFADAIAGDLSSAGFAVVRPEDTLDRSAASPSDAAYPETLHRAAELFQTVKAESAVDTTPAEAASALNVARTLDADCLVMASILSVGENTVRSSAYGLPTSSRTRVLRVALRVLDGRDGRQLYGDRVVVTDRIIDTAYQQTDAGDQLDMLLDQASSEIASRVRDATASGSFNPAALAGNAAAIATDAISVTINAFPAAAVELDGVLIGTAPGTFRLSPGVHRLRVAKEGYAAWEHSVKLVDGQTLDIALEYSATGLDRRGQQMAQDRDDDVIRQQSEAQAALAHGQAVAASNSYMRIEGAPQVLSVGSDAPTGVIVDLPPATND